MCGRRDERREQIYICLIRSLLWDGMGERVGQAKMEFEKRKYVALAKE